MTITAEQFRQPAQAIVDRHCHYGFCDRCGGSCDPEQYDCSGMQCKCANVTHLLPYQICTSSFVIATMCWDAGLYMTAQQFEADDGPEICWAFHGANLGRTDDGSRPNGASGHIVLVVRVRNPDGTTKGFYTCEAMGRRYGCVNGSYYGRAWTALYRIPGVLDHPPSPPAPVDLMEPTMFRQIHHYNIDTGAITGPTKPGHGRDSIISVAVDGSAIECRDGASIVGDGAVSGAARSLRRWTSPKNPPPAGVKFRSVIYRPGDADDFHPGGIALLSNGDIRRFHLS